VLLFTQKKETAAFLTGSLGSSCRLLTAEDQRRSAELVRLADLVIIDIAGGQRFDPLFLQTLRGINARAHYAALSDAAAQVDHAAGFDSVIDMSMNRDSLRQTIIREIERTDMRHELEIMKGRREETAAPGFSAPPALPAPQIVRHLTTLVNRRIFDADAFMQNFVTTFKEVSKVSRAALIVKDPQSTQAYRVQASFGIEEDLLKYLTFSAGEGILGGMARDCAIMRKESAHYKAARELDLLKVMYAVPLVSDKGLYGVLAFNNRVTGVPFSDEDLLGFYELSASVAQVAERTADFGSLHLQRYVSENVIDEISSGVVTVDAKGRLTTVNKAARGMFGIAPGDASEVARAKLTPAFLSVIKETLESGLAHGFHEVAVNGTSHILDVDAYRITDAAGHLVGASFVFDDPHYETTIEKEARQAERLEFVNKIALRSSHELRNCLVSIRTFTQLLPEKYVDEQFRKDFYSVVSKEVERLSSLVDKLLFFAQPISLQYAKVNINELVDQSISAIKGSEDGSVTVNKHFSHQLPFIEVDREQMTKAFANIIQNAHQAMQKGGRLIITTRESIQDGSGESALVVQFRDTGKGVSLPDNQEVFEPFFSTKSRGLGLGLTIAKKIVEEHGGSVRFESKKEGGAEVLVVVPREPRKASTVALGGAPHAHKGTDSLRT